MGFIAAGAAIAGIGLQAYGTSKATSAAKESAQLQQQEIAQEQQVEAQRQQQMDLDARRRNMEILRNATRARSSAVAASTASGAQFGSGLPGAYGQTQGQSDNQLLANAQNLQIGQNIFGINSQISQTRIGMAGAQSNMYAAQGLASLGGSIVNSIGQISRIGPTVSSGFGNMMSFGTGPGSFTSKGSMYS